MFFDQQNPLNQNPFLIFVIASQALKHKGLLIKIHFKKRETGMQLR